MIARASLMQPIAAWDFLQASCANHAIKSWEVRVSKFADSFRYTAVVVTYKRNADGNLSRSHRGPIRYTDRLRIAEEAVMDVAIWVWDTVPESREEA